MTTEINFSPPFSHHPPTTRLNRHQQQIDEWANYISDVTGAPIKEIPDAPGVGGAMVAGAAAGAAAGVGFGLVM